MTDQPEPPRSVVAQQRRQADLDHDLERPEDPNYDSQLHVLRRIEEVQSSARLILFGLLVVETISSLCLLFIIIYSLAV